GDRGAVSKPSLVLDPWDAEQPAGLLEDVALLVGVLRAAEEGDRVRAVDGDVLVAQLLGRDPRFVADLVDLARDLFRGVFPLHLFPAIAAGRAVERLGQTLRRGVRREHRDAFDAQGAAADDVVEVALHRYQLAVPDGGDHAAAARTEVAGGGELADLGEFELPRGRARRGHVEETAEREPGAAAHGQPQEVSAGDRSDAVRCVAHPFTSVISSSTA